MLSTAISTVNPALNPKHKSEATMANSRIKRALIICDMQPDAMPSLFTSAARREAFLHAVQSVLLAATSSPLPVDNSLIVFTGLRFPSRYEGLHPEHCLYGSLRRLNEKVGDGAAHWFMEEYSGSEIHSSLMDLVQAKGDDLKYQVLWRTGHLPSLELMEILGSNSITDATVVGAKASQTVQATVQFIAEHCPSIDLSVVEEALADDKQDRLDAVTQHLLPLYARVAILEEYVDATCGTERLAQEYSLMKQLKRQHVHYYVDCERGGHYSLYIHHLIHREGSCWHKHPRQKWYEDVFCAKQFYCPLGKRVVDFCDEPQFSAVSMFLKGRDCLDDKGKLIKLAKDYLPETYVMQGGTECEGFHLQSSGPWFVKETNKNGGRAITVCKNGLESIALASNPNETYVIQRHVPNSSLLKDGRKWHLKVYNLLICDEEGCHWTLRCHNEPFLCAASEPWSADDLSPEVQITIRRTKRVKPDVVIEEFADSIDNKRMFQQCTNIVASVVERAIESNGLQGRPGKKQFEVFSSDFIFDTEFKAHLIEFNFSPTLFDPLANQELTTVCLKAYMKDFELHGDDAAINDHAMIKDVISMVFYPKQTFAKKEEADAIGGWEFIKSFVSTK